MRERIGKPEEEIDLPASVRTVGELVAWLSGRGEEYAYAFENAKVIRAAIDRTHVKPDTRDCRRARDRVLPADDRRLSVTVRIQREDFDIGAEIARLTQGRTDVGAVATFTGICRDDGIVAMTLEHYPGMAEAEIERHVEEAQARWPLIGVTVIHRHGRMVPGDNIVLVATASSHREAAFAAAEFLMDYLKTRAPFWKKEERAGGAGWVEARHADSRRRRSAGRATDETGGRRMRPQEHDRRKPAIGLGSER